MTTTMALLGVPVLAALLLLALPGMARALHLAGGVLLLLAAIAHAIASPADAAMAPFILLLAVVLLAVAPTLPAARRRAALPHLAIGAGMASLLAADVLALWAGSLVAGLLLAALLADGARDAAWKALTIIGTGALLALFGLVALHAAMPATGLSLTEMARAAPSADAGMLQLAMLFTLLGFGVLAALPPLHAWAPDAAAALSPAEAALPLVLLPLLGLSALLRLHGLAPGGMAGQVLVALGALGLLLGGFALWRRRDARRLLAFVMVMQSGLAAMALGLGGPAGRMAAVLAMLGAALAMTAALVALEAAARAKGSTRIAAIGGLAGSEPALGWGFALALLALAGLPPFLPFAAEFLLLTSAARQAPWLLLPLLLGLVVGATAIARAAQLLCLGAPTPDAPGAARPGLGVLLPLHGLLLLLLIGALAMPAPFTAWLRTAAGWP